MCVCVCVCGRDEFDSDDSSDAGTDDETHPQSKSELASRAMRSVVKRESAMRRQDQFDLHADVPAADRPAKKDRHHKQQKPPIRA